METGGEKFKRLRESRKLIQGELAHNAGCSPSYIQQIEGNRLHRIGFRVLKGIADALGVTPEHILEITGLEGGRKKRDEKNKATGVSESPNSPTPVEQIDLLPIEQLALIQERIETIRKAKNISRKQMAALAKTAQRPTPPPSPTLPDAP